MKTSDLTGTALDWAVARSLGIPAEELRVSWMGLFRLLRDEDGKLNGMYQTGPDLTFSRKWEAGGPIIEHEEISVVPPGSTAWWVAQKNGHLLSGLTPLIAAMRCFVALKLGPVVELPKELL